MKFKMCLFGIPLLLGFTPQANGFVFERRDRPASEGPNLKFLREYECFKALSKYTEGRGLHLSVIPGILFHGTYRANRKGFYLFTLKNSSFCEFTADQQTRAKKDHSFNFQIVSYATEKPETTTLNNNFEPIFIEYGLLDTTKSPKVRWNQSPEAVAGKKYETLNCFDYNTPESTDALHRELQNRISSVRSAYDKALKERKLELSGPAQPDKPYKEVLNTCSDVKRDEVKDSVKVELKKIEPGWTPNNSGPASSGGAK